MKVHDLKSAKKPFEDVWDLRKKAEVRFNDRSFSVGDILRLREWDPERKYSGRELWVLITHIQEGYGLPKDLVVISFEPKERVHKDGRKEACANTPA